MSASFSVRIGRVYDQPKAEDGVRILVDRLWPRGLAKASVSLDSWCKDVAPSRELRTWYGHDPDRFEEFVARYRAELEEPVPAAALEKLVERARAGTLTLLTATKSVEISQAAVLAQVLEERA